MTGPDLTPEQREHGKRLMRYAEPYPDYPSDHVEDPICCTLPPECVPTGMWALTEDDMARMLADALSEGRNDGYDTGWDDAHSKSVIIDQRIADARAEAVADFVNRQAVEYRKHSAHAVYEDMILAVRDFGVSPEAFYDEPELRAALARAATPTDQP